MATETAAGPPRAKAGRRRRIVIGIVLLVAVLITVVLAIVLVAGSRASDARDLLTRYLDAIASGDAETANEIAPLEMGDVEGVRPSPTAGEQTANPDLTAAALAGAAFAGGETIADVEVGEISPLPAEDDGADRLQAPVSYTVGGERVEDSLVLRREGTQWLFFPVWGFEEPLVESVRVDATLVDAFNFTIGDVELSYDLEQSVPIALYPGQYRVTRAASEYLEAEDQVVAVGGGEAEGIRFEGAVTPGFLDELQAAAAADIDRCTAPSTSYNSECSVYPDDVAYIRDPVAWTVEQAPGTVEFAPGDWQGETTASLRADYEGRETLDEPFTPMSEVVEMRGTIGVTFTDPESYEYEIEWDGAR